MRTCVILLFVALAGSLFAQDPNQKLREASFAEAVRLFPSAGVKGSPLDKEVARIATEWSNPLHPNHPVLGIPNGPELIVLYAAKQIGLISTQKPDAGTPELPSGIGKPAPIGTTRGLDGLLRNSDAVSPDFGAVIPENTREFQAYAANEEAKLQHERTVLEGLKAQAASEKQRKELQGQLWRIEQAINGLKK